MRDIIVIAGTAVGSVLELTQQIKNEVGCKAFVLCSDYKTSKIFESSKYVDEVLHITDNDQAGYVACVKNWFKEKCFVVKPILYFTTDTGCLYVDNHRIWFENNFKLCLASSEIVKTYTQKGLAEASAVKAGLSIPKTQVLDTESDVTKVNDTFSFPVILKPRATYLKANIDFKIKVVHDKMELIIVTKKLLRENNTLLCQEFIPGDDNTSFYFLFYRAMNGVLFKNMGRKTLQSTSNGGIMVKGLVEHNEELLRICENFLNQINYKGIGGIEFKKFGGEYYFIEMSTRLEGFFKIAEISNSPLSLLSYYDLSNDFEKRDDLKDAKQKDGVVYIDFMIALVTRLRNKAYLPLISDVFSIMFKHDTKINIFSRNDSKPFWLSFKNLVYR